MATAKLTHHIFNGVILSPEELDAEVRELGIEEAQPADFALQSTFADVVVDGDGYHPGQCAFAADVGLVKTSIQVGSVQFRALVDATTPTGRLWLTSIFRRQRLCWLLDDAVSGDALFMTVSVKHKPQTRLAYIAAAARPAPRSAFQAKRRAKELAEATRLDAEPSYIPGVRVQTVVVIVIS